MDLFGLTPKRLQADRQMCASISNVIQIVADVHEICRGGPPAKNFYGVLGIPCLEAVEVVPMRNEYSSGGMLDLNKTWCM